MAIHPPSMRRIFGSIAVLLLLTAVFLYHTKFPVFRNGCPAFFTNLEEKWSTTDMEEKWSTDGYRRYTSSMYLKHRNSTRTLRGESSTVGPWLVCANSGHAENLLEQQRYTMAFFTGDGFTNAFVALSNQIYVSILASRIPILHPFAPGHLAWEAGFLPVNEVFDLGRWAHAINKDILELEQIKSYPDDNDKEQIGCWSIWAAGYLKDAKPSRTSFVDSFKLGKCYSSQDPTPVIH